MTNKVERKPAAPPNKGFNWKDFLIKSAIAIAIFNVIAALVTCYFVLPVRLETAIFACSIQTRR
jgi:hypothetical protein